MAIATWWILALGVLTGLLPRWRPSSWGLTGLAGLTALLAVTAASLLWTSATDRTEVEIARVTHLLGSMLLVAMLAGRTSLRPLTRGVLAGLAAVCALALASRLAPGAFPQQEALRTFETSRLSYPLNYWNALAALGAMTATGLVGWSSHTRGIERALALALAPIATTVVLLTYSRAGLGSMAVGVAVLLVVSRHRWTVGAHATIAALGGVAAILTVREHPAIADATGGAGAGPVLLVVVAAAGMCAAGRPDGPLRAGPGPTLAARHAYRALRLGSARARRRPARAWPAPRRLGAVQTAGKLRYVRPGGAPYFAQRVPLQHLQSAGRAFEAAPLKGHGAGTFDFWFNRHGGVPYLRDAHSLYLETAAELGLAGLAGLLLMLGGLAGGVVTALRRPRD